MVDVSTANANDRIDMSDPALVDFFSFLNPTPEEFSWVSPADAGSSVFIQGSGFTYSGSGDGRELASGSIGLVSIDFGFDNDTRAAGDLVITDTSLLVGSAIDKDDPRTFWNEVLKGGGEIDLTGLDEDLVGFGQNVVFGDDLASAISRFAGTTDQGGHDFFRNGDNQMDIIGDAFTVAGQDLGTTARFADYDAGNDIFFVGSILESRTDRNLRLVGDAFNVGPLAVLQGGTDEFNIFFYTGTAIVVGEAFNQTGGTVNGASDIISTSDGTLEASGEVHNFSGGTLNAVRDIFDDNHFGGRIAGDVFTIQSSATGAINCGGDQISGRVGNDVLSGDVFTSLSTSVTVLGGADKIHGGGGGDIIVGELASGSLANFSGGNDSVFGLGGHDEIHGQTGADRLDGGDGRDTIEGGEGNDVLLGAAHNDTLTGGAGQDRLIGGNGPDRFDYNLTSESVGPARDVIVDFDILADRIDLFDIDAVEGGGVNDQFSFIGEDPFTAAGQVRAVQAGAHTLVQLNTAGAAGAEAAILLRDFTASTLSAEDFVL